MAPKRKHFKQPSDSADNAGDQEHPARRPRHRSRSSSRHRHFPRSQSPIKVVEDGIGPKIRIPAILHYLQDNDIDHTANWTSQLEDIISYLEYADELRRNGHKDFDSQLTGELFDCQVVLGVHRAYEKRSRGKTPYSETKLPTVQPPTHLSWYDQLLPFCKEAPVPSRISLIPREWARSNSPFHFINRTCTPELYDYYFETTGAQRLVKTLTRLQRDENLSWNSEPSTKPVSIPSRLNLAEIENMVYEENVVSEDKLFKNYAQNRGPLMGEPASMDKIVKQRGWRRAALEQLLHLFDNEENRSVNTPWRRVALPTRVKQRKELPFHTPAKLINRVEVDDGVKNVVTQGIGHSSEEPSPWVYWYNEYLEQSNVLSAFTRRNYMLQSWNKRSEIALPPNFTGPYTFNGKCVYDDNWLKVGKQCVLLRKNLKRTAGMYDTNSRFLPTLVEDIERGLSGLAPANTLKPRPKVDYDPSKDNTFLLLDEFDMAWLKFLMEPGYAPGLIKYSNNRPQHNLLILFDHRIQTLFNDTHNNMFWDLSAEDHKGFPSYTSQKVPLTELLAIINRGGRKLGKEKGQHTWHASDLNDQDANPPNTLYQFTLEEARFACINLARQGRLFYEGPIMGDVDQYINNTEWDQDKQCRFYQTKNRNDWGCVGMHKTEIFPEQRIIWRHASNEAFTKFNEYYEKHTKTLFMDDSEIGKRKSFVPEAVFQVGAYAKGGFEEARESPIWEDIVPIDVAAANELDVSERSSQFFRNLAFRLGRTIRHYQMLQQRVAKSPSLSRILLKAASAAWQGTVRDAKKAAKDAGYTPTRFTELTDVIPRAAPAHVSAKARGSSSIFTAIRQGLIKDSVQNLTQTYPSRPSFRPSEKDQGVKIKTFHRQNVWGWADQMIREHHAPYTRERYFDMRRWPLHRQSTATQEIIRTRKDEATDLQSPLAWWRYGIQVGPVSKALVKFDNSVIDVLPNRQLAAASEIVRKFKQALVVSMRNANVNLQDDWQVIINPPVIINPSIRDPSRLLPAPGPSLEPIVRPTSKFVPGPPFFPMGETLLKQIQISQELESMLDPHPQNLGAKLMGKVTSWFTPEPEPIPLLPEIDASRAPRSNPLKRRLPSAFLSDIEPARKVVALSDPTNDHVPTRGRRLLDARGPIRPAAGLLGGAGHHANLADILGSADERERSRRERVEAVASFLGGKVIDQDQPATAPSVEASVPAPVRPAWKVKSKAQNVRKPNEVPTIVIEKNEDDALTEEGAGALSLSKKVTFDLKEGYVWPASVPRPRYSIKQDDGTEAVVIDQEDHRDLERAVRVPLSQWPATQDAPPSIVLHVNPSRQYTDEDVQRAPELLTNPFSDDTAPIPSRPVTPNIYYYSSSSTGSPFSGRFSSSGTSVSDTSTAATSLFSSRRGGLRGGLAPSQTSSQSNSQFSSQPASRSTSRSTSQPTSQSTSRNSSRGSRFGSASTSQASSRPGSRVETAAGTDSPETAQLPSGRIVDVSRISSIDALGQQRHIMTRGWMAVMNEMFPKGYDTLPTSGRDNLCGIFSIVLSLKRQYPSLPGVSTLTDDSLLEMANDLTVRARISDMGESWFNASSNFTIDTLAAMLEVWGRANNVAMSLGIVFHAASKRDPMVVSNPLPEGVTEEHVVWIHSDDASFRGAASGMSDREVLEEDRRLGFEINNHFSGLAPKTRVSARLVQV